MKLIIDANILFAALIKTGLTADLITSPKLELFCPPFIFEEFEKYKSYLLDKTKREPEEFMRYMNILKRNIRSIPLSDFEGFLPRAKQISPDGKDGIYFALALYMNAPIWTNDKRLKTQNEVSILSTSDLIRIIPIEE